ncbi:hypothetical protein ACFWN1_32980 [Streptomyces sp. NPDC058459]|uniref:hypothetical protein n=1 Tax=Streptomyces sp. NPDC058459 TaxID=3346508 RepID=UPI003661403A
MTNRLRAEYTELLDGHLPTGPALLVAGGRHIDPGVVTDLGPALHQLPDRNPGTGRRGNRDDRGPVLTSRSVLAWLTAGHGTLIVDALPYGVLPEAAVADLVTHLARAGHHERADALLTDLGVLGVRMPGSAKAGLEVPGRRYHAVRTVGSHRPGTGRTRRGDRLRRPLGRAHRVPEVDLVSRRLTRESTHNWRDS